MGLLSSVFSGLRCSLRPMRVLLILAALSGISSCASAPLNEWQAEYGQQHPLAGSIWSLKGGQRVNAYLEYLDLSAPWLLIGEVHDNPDHHRIQRQLLETQLREGRRPALVFEQFDQDQQALIDDYLHKDLGALEMQSGFSKRGWDWAYYRPLLELAARYDLPVYAGNLSRKVLKELGTSQPPDGLSQLLKVPLAENAIETLSEDIRTSHCNMLEEDIVERMVKAQRLRDAGLAQTMIGASEPAVLIAGNGHVRRDYGAGGILEGREWRSVLSVGLIEVQPGQERLEDYPELYQQGRRVFDIVIFTPRARDEDPCETFRSQLEAMGKP